jgi:hypothetical protein
MKRYLVLIFVALMGLYLVFASGEKITDMKYLDLSVKKQEIKSMGTVKPDIDFGKIPLYFTTNKGQVNEKAKFYAKASRYTLWLTKEGLVFDSVKKVETTHPAPPGHPSQEGSIRGFPHSPHSTNPPKLLRDVSRLIFLNSNKNPDMVPVDKAKLRVNYFIGNDKSKWHCDVPTYMAVLYKNLYKNIDLKVYGLEKQIEYDWIVKTGGDPGDISFRYKNVKRTRIDEEGNLLIETDFGELIHKKPVSYQEIGRERQDIDVTFKKIAENTYGFEVGAYDRSRQLIIDPVVLAYSTYLGGANTDYAYGIAVDAGGSAYVTGNTISTNFPTLDHFQAYQECEDVFVTRLDPNQGGASSLLYSTYLGGGYGDGGIGIAVDGSGNAYVTGYTYSTDFPTLNQYQADQGACDVFVTRLDTAQSGSSSLLYSTYLGGGDYDCGHGIAVDGNGYAYVTGDTCSTDFPTLNKYQEYQGGTDVFVTRLDTTQSGAAGLLYSTYLGGGSGDHDMCLGIAVDGSGNAYVTGYTDSTDFPTLNQYQSYQGSTDVFVTKLDPTQSGVSSLLYSTYLGGVSFDAGYGIAVDASGSAYVTGFTDSTDFPTLNQYQGDQGYRDVFVTRLDPTQSGVSSLLYSTYLGGGDLDNVRGIAVDGSGNAYVTGTTYSTDFPTLNQYQGDQGYSDGFVTRLDPTQSGAASLLYSTYLGGGSGDYGRCIAVDTGGNAYVAGYTESTDFPTLNQYQGHQGGYDAFVTKLSYTVPGPEINIKQESTVIPDQGILDFGNAAQGVTVEKIFTIENTGTADLSLDDLPLQITGPDAGQFSIDTQPSTPVSTQGSTTFTISFNPSSLGNKTATISIENNDPDENPYDITLNGSSFNNPGWEPVGGMQYNMIVLGTAYNQASLASAGDWIGAFGPGGETDCRAVAQVEANGSYYLTVQGDTLPGEQINFKLWPLPGGPALDSMENLEFLADHVYQDQELHFVNHITLDLTCGWNWISSNVLPPDASFDSIFSGIADNIQQVKSQTQSAIRTGDAWVGDLPDMSGIGIGSMYKIKTSAPCSLTVNGSRISPETQISLDNSWTWVAYLPTTSLPVADAIDSVFPILDQVKSQTQSVLKVGSILIGDLSEMHAGLGYTIKTTAAGILQYPAAQYSMINNIIDSESGCTPSWTPITGNQYTMIALGNVYLVGEAIDTTGYYVGSFGPGGVADCRSLSEVTGNGTYFATIRGNTNGETIGFKLYECSTGKTYEIEETFSFLSDDLKPDFDLHTIPPVISGCVTDDGTGLAGVTLTFGSIGGTTTGADGNYSYQVEYNWTGRVTPEPEGYTFEPDSRDYSNVTSNRVNQNYTAQLANTITITSPNGDEDWIAGSIEKITWAGPGITGSLMIEYSENNGASWTTVTQSTDNDGSYDWTVPGNPSENCLVRVIAGETDESPADVSDAVFSIVPPTPAAITVTSPNGGESLTVGTKHEITWNSTGDIGNVKIEYSIDNGTSWSNTTVYTANNGSYTWTVPDSPSDNCLVRIGASDTDESTPDVSDGVFSIVPEPLPTILVTSPNGGENLIVGATHKITWNSTGSISEVKIEYSTNNGTSWTAITTSVPNTGSYDWIVPGNPSDTCQVRVSEISGDPSDTGDAVFSIVLPPSFTITSPNGGENWEAGSSHPITWTGTGSVDNVNIEYTTDNGASWETIDSSAVNNGSRNWTVPGTISESCLVRISESNKDGGPADASDAVFSIITASSPTLAVTSPNGGEHLITGSTHAITWTGTGNVENVKIEYSLDNGNDWVGIIASTVNTGSYDWAVPDTVSDNCLVRVGDSDGDPADASNAVFSIASPSFITITSPNGGETLEAGSSHPITWTGTGTPEEVKIEYSTDNGTSWTTIVTAAPNNGANNSYNWTIPGTPSGDCLVRISGIDADEGESDISDTSFSIEPAPVITITSPNGGESLTAGSIHEITWTCTGSIAEVKIDYSIDDGTSWAYIVPAAANNGDSGSYNWIVPGTPSANCLVRIIGGSSDGAPSDVSDAVFSIISPSETVTVTSPNGGESLSVGSTHVITWTCSGSVDSVNIEYSINNGTSWTGIISAAFNNGSFEWTVPDTPSGNCLVRISDTGGGSADVSDAAFSIVSPSTAAITVTSPNGGENLSAGSTHEITWTGEGTVGDVNIEYSIDNGNSWTMIELAAGNNSSYNWTVPGTPSNNCLVRISGVDTDEAPTDVSDSVFSII